MSRSVSFGKRTLAIALAASVATTGFQVVAPSVGAPFGAVALAQVTNDSVTEVKLTDANGEVTGDVRKAGNVTADSAFPELGEDAKLNVKINIANVNSGDTVTIAPVTSYVDPRTGNNATSNGVGIELATTQADAPLALPDGTVIAKLDAKTNGTATVTFTDAVDTYASGSLDVVLPVTFGTRYTGDVGPGGKPEAKPLEGDWKVTVKASGSDESKDFAERKIVTTQTGESTFIVRKDVHSGGQGSEIVNDTVNIFRLDQRLPTAKNSRVVLTPTPSTEKSYRTGNAYGDWKFSEEVEPRVILWEFDNEGFYKGTIDKPEDVAAAGITYKVTEGATAANGEYYKDGSLYIDVYGAEGTNYKPIVTLNSKKPVVGTAPYDEGRELAVTADITRIDDDGNVIADEESKTYTHIFRKLPGTVSGGADGQAKTRTAEVDGEIKGDPAAGKSTPARIAGKSTDFTFTVNNTGNTPLTKVIITPAGGEPVEKEVSIAPGESGTVDLTHEVPANAAQVSFTVESEFFTVEGNPVTFLVDQSSKYQQNPDGSVTITDPSGNEVIVVSWDEYQKLVARVAELEGKQDVYVVEGVRNADNSITLTLNNGDKIVIPAANKAGLERCLNAPGGTLLALLPVLGVATAGLSQINVEAINKSITDWQKQAGIYNEEAAKFVAQNRGALGALLGSLVASLILFVPGLCGDVSLAGALKEAYGEGSSKKTAPEDAPESEPAQ